VVDVIEFMAKHGDATKAVALGIAAAMAVWAYSAAAAAVATLAATWPFLAIAAVVAVVAYLIIKHWDTIKAAAIKVWTAISGFIGGVWEWLKSSFTVVKDFLIAAWDTLTAPIIAVWSFIWAGIKLYIDLVHIYLTVVVGVILALWDMIKAPIIAVWSFIWAGIKLYIDMVKTYIGWVVAAVKAIWDTLKGPLVAAWSFISDRVSAIKDGLVSKWTEFKNLIVGIWEGVRNAIAGIVQKIYDNTIGRVKEMIDKINDLKEKLGSISVTGVRTKVGSVLPGKAVGGPSSGGLTMVGEYGPELVNLPAGANVNTAANTANLLAGGGGAGGIHIHVYGSVIEGERTIQKVVKETLLGGGYAGMIGV
jgi:hypothetical protein